MARLANIEARLAAAESAVPKGSYEIGDDGLFKGGTFNREEFIFLASSFADIPWLVGRLNEALYFLRRCRGMHDFAACKDAPTDACRLCRFLASVAEVADAQAP